MLILATASVIISYFEAMNRCETWE